MEPGLPVERLRLADGLLELGAVELALTTDEAQALLREAGVELPKEEVDDLTRTTEGWAAGLYLAALALRDETKRSVPRTPFTGDDRFVTDYLRTEHLARLPRKQVQFLTRTAVLDRMCGDLCDAVLERSDSARMLESIERSNLFLVPLDHTRTWYRYHQLFRDVLRTELQRREPDLVAELYRRAADWCEQHELPEEALRYAAAGDDTDRAARLSPRSRCRSTAPDGWPPPRNGSNGWPCRSIATRPRPFSAPGCMSFADVRPRRSSGSTRSSAPVTTGRCPTAAPRSGRGRRCSARSCARRGSSACRQMPSLPAPSWDR